MSFPGIYDSHNTVIIVWEKVYSKLITLTQSDNCDISGVLY